MNPLLLMFGGKEITVGAKDVPAVLNEFLKNSVPVAQFRNGEDGAVRVTMSAPAARRLLREAETRGWEIRVTREFGIPHTLWRYRRRAGLFLGMLLAGILTWTSGRVVWDVRVSGNETVPTAVILDGLRECGLSVGARTDGIHAGELENRFLILSDEISWISVCMDGTVANVQVIENKIPPEDPPKKPANLIAAADGQIEVLQLYHGQSVVKVGQAVRKGDLLVSGIYQSPTMQCRFLRAAGEVLARTEHEFTVEIPLTYEQKDYGAAKRGEVTLSFFDFSLNFFKKTGNQSKPCDIIKEEIRIPSPSWAPVPVYLTVEKRMPYETVFATRSYEDALDEAYGELEKKLASLSGSAQLLRKDVRTTLTETSVVLDCTVLCVENIALTSEFEITG